VGRTAVAKRLVFHVGGYDPITPHASAQRRFVREIRRFELTWSVKASISALHEGVDETKWSVIANGPNWHVETDFHLVRWDDVIEQFRRRTIWQRIPLGVIAFLDFVTAGALWGYFRTNWHYAAFFLYPFVMFGALIATAYFVGVYALHASETIPAIITIGSVLAAFVLGCWRWLHLDSLFDDWIFSRAYVRRGNAILEQRLHRIAQEIVSVAHGSDADELLVVGHSLGAVIAVDLLDRALKLDPSLGRQGIPITFLSIGSSILKIGLHKGAKRFRAAVEHVAQAPGIFWGDYQARIDIMNFYNTDPMAEMSLTTEHGPVVRLVEFSRTLERVMYRSIRLKFYRVHCQFISGNDKRALYDYFMLVCGPVSAKCQTMAPDGALSIIGDDGALISKLACSEPLSEPARPA
jgi:hypothetical protein